MASVVPESLARQRAERYRALACEARRGADGTTGAAHDSWAFVERQWECLAWDADAEAAREIVKLGLFPAPQ